MNPNKGVSTELKRIAAENGGVLRREDVVREAEAKASPLHSYFEWDDTEAAHKWRLEQAGQLIRVTVEYISDGEMTVPFRTFVSLTSDRKLPGGGYRATVSVMNAPDKQAQLLRDALFDLESFQRKYGNLRALARLFVAQRSEMRRLRKTLNAPVKSVRRKVAEA